MNYPFKEYWEEGKIRLFYLFFSYIIVFSIMYIYKNEVFYLLLNPLFFSYHSHHLIYTHLMEVFLSYLSLCFFSSIFTFSPFIFYQIFTFFLPGLYKIEVKKSLIIYFLSIFSFFFSFILIYFFIIPFFWNFFLEFQILEKNEIFHLFFETRMEQYIDWAFFCFFIFIIIFQIPILFIFIHFYIFSFKNIAKFKLRKMFIILYLIFIFLFIPPDFIIQIIFFIIINIINELSFFIYYILRNYQKKIK